MNSSASPPPERADRPANERLDSWKEIGAYLKRDIRTVQRWEKRESLPVHRHTHDKLGSVYAYREELDAWWNNHQPQLGEGEKIRLHRLPGRWLLALGVLVLAGGSLVVWRFPKKTIPQPAIVRRVLATGEMAFVGAVSPDGRLLSYVDTKTGTLGVHDVKSGTARLLTNDADWSEYALGSIFSTDGRQIAYSWSNRDWFQELRLIGADGSAPRVLYRDPATACLWPADWSADGEEILAVFSTADGTYRIVTVSTRDGSVRSLKLLGRRSPGRAGFSPDGRYVAYDRPAGEDRSERDIYLLTRSTDPGGASEVPLVQHPADDFFLGWIPGGTQVVFGSDRAGGWDAWAIRPGPDAPILVRRNLGRIEPIGFTRSGAYYYSVGTTMKEVHVAEIDPAAGSLLGSSVASGRRRVGSNALPEWSPDGRYLLYRSHYNRRSRATTLLVQSWSTGEERELRLPLTVLPGARWSPDGASILTTGWDPEGRQGIYKIDVQTGTVASIVQQPGVHVREGIWLPDGGTIVYNANDPTIKGSRLIQRQLRSGREHVLYRGPFVTRMALSPDGSQLAFVSGPTLSVVPLVGAEPRVILRSDTDLMDVAWATDARYLLLAKSVQSPSRQPATELWRVRADGAGPRALGLTMDAIPQIRCHPDGRRIAYAVGASSLEIWEMEGLLPLASH